MHGLDGDRKYPSNWNKDKFTFHDKPAFKHHSELAKPIHMANDFTTGGCSLGNGNNRIINLFA
jgi:hypothetical protein